MTGTLSRLELAIAWRYLRSRRGSRLLSFITVIAIGGMVVGVSALIVIIGVMNGLQNDLREKILVGSPDLRVLNYGDELRIRDWRDVLHAVLESQNPHVVLTGGEPLLQPDIVPLAHALRAEKRIVTIETAGTVFRPVEADLMSISPKMSNSTPRETSRWQARHARDRDRPNVIRQLMLGSRYQLKFVVDQPIDLDEIVEYLDRFPDVEADCVWLMPQGIRQQELEEKAIWMAPAAEGLGYRFCPRRQIELFGSVRGT